MYVLASIVCVYIYICSHLYVSMYICVRILLNIYVCVYKNMYLYTYAYTFMRKFFLRVYKLTNDNIKIYSNGKTIEVFNIGMKNNVSGQQIITASVPDY